MSCVNLTRCRWSLLSSPGRLVPIVWLICFFCVLQPVLYHVTRFSSNSSSLARLPASLESIKIPVDFTSQVWNELHTEYRKLAGGITYCPLIPSNLTGYCGIKNVSDINYNATFDIDIPYFNLSLGGHYKPSECQSRHRVLLVVPYKNRLENLNRFLYHMHPFLQRQQLEYTIVVVEQVNDALFNKGVLMNAAFLEASGIQIINKPSPKLSLILGKSSTTVDEKIKLNNSIDHPFDCVIFHDVDLLPEDDRIMYSCPPTRARHLSTAIDKYQYKVFYDNLIGGVLNFRREHYIKVNGYSNEYWAWGGEDDDMAARLKSAKIGFERPNARLARYTMLKHDKRTINPKRHRLLKSASRRYESEGLNSVQYRLVDVIRYRMFTHLLIDVGDPPIDLIRAIERANTTAKAKSYRRMKPTYQMNNRHYRLSKKPLS